MNEQVRIEQRILELHRLIAERLNRHPAQTLRAAERNLREFRRRFGDRSAFEEWSRLLSAGAGDVHRVLTETSDHATWLRSMSPFIGILPRAERNRIMSPNRKVRRVDPLDLA